MREIKFRVWDPAEKQMCPVIAADFQDNQSKVFCRLPKSGAQEIFSADLMQYTGVKDKNGVEIYDGDIIHFPYDWFGDSGKDFIVRWNESCCAFVREPISGSRMWGHASREILSMCEVVGNIYENPELVSNETDT